MGLVWSSSGFWLLSSLIRTMDVADPEDMTWRRQLLSTDHKHIRESVDSLCRDGADAQYMQQDLKTIKNVKGCRDDMPKSMQIR